MTLEDIERGYTSTIAINGDEIVKTTLSAYDSRTAAENAAQELLAYRQELDDQPLRVVPLRSVEVTEDEQGYHLRHAYDLIDGPSLTALPLAGRQEAMARVLSQVAGMDTLGAPDILRTPFDAKSDNFHVDNVGPALVDVFPALRRLPDGGFPLRAAVNGSPRGRNQLLSRTMGTKSGAMTKILSTAIDRGDTKISTLSHIMRTTDDWCYDTLPGDMDTNVRNKVRTQISRHFLPYMVRVAQDRAWVRINR